MKSSKTKGKKSKAPVGNGGFMTEQDMSKYKRDTKNRAPSGRAALYTKFDAVTKETIGKSGLALFRAAAAYLTKKTKTKFTPQMFQKRYGQLAPGPQTMAVRASMRGGGKALLAGASPYKRKGDDGKPAKRAVKATKRVVTKSKSKQIVKKKVTAKRAPVVTKAAKPVAKKRASKPGALRTSAPAVLAEPKTEALTETLQSSVPTVEIVNEAQV